MPFRAPKLLLFFALTVLTVGLFVYLLNIYYSLVTKEENVLSTWTQVEANYLQKDQLVGQMIKIIKNDVQRDKKLADIVDQLQSEAVQAHQITQSAVGHMNDENYMVKIDHVQRAVSQKTDVIITKLTPDQTLQAREQFLELKQQIAEKDRQIETSRKAFNESVSLYNASIERLPASFVANMNHFKRKAYFKSDAMTDKTMIIDFEIR